MDDDGIPGAESYPAGRRSAPILPAEIRRGNSEEQEIPDSVHPVVELLPLIGRLNSTTDELLLLSIGMITYLLTYLVINVCAIVVPKWREDVTGVKIRYHPSLLFCPHSVLCTAIKPVIKEIATE